MADAKLPKTIPCQFNAGGWNPCKKPTDNGWCSKHENLKCVSCGEKAVKSCDVQMGGLGCGSPLCKTCEHKPGGEWGHVTKEIAKQMRVAAKKEKEKNC
ncbi:MAG TPA: hypothetical protein PKZ36_00660 [Candidatus Paceibacterota bacterium]|mgnify:CR=1 FL=1|nr:hypothetical protein [Candidatus Paceibacterota bacterium]HPT17910.1 hypothetical protein [Candidatus Paceibacterota bacterium]